MTTTNSNLERVLASGAFAVTSECGPPRSADRDVILKKGLLLKNSTDAVNVTDNQTAIVRMSSLAACAILRQIGIDPVWQIVCRDRFIYDDYQMNGDRPNLFIGAAENPFADPFEFRVIRLGKKVANGARFIQTQCIFNIEKFAKWMKSIRNEGLDEKVYILGGVTPLKSAGMAKYMKNRVAGMDVPDSVIARMAGAPKGREREEGIKIAVETIKKLKRIKGVAGVHIMAIEWEDIVPEIVEAAGLADRP